MKKTLLCFSLLMITLLTHAQNTFEHVFYSSHNTIDRDACKRGLALPDGDYIAMGGNPGCDFCGKTYYIRKYDHQGNLLFEKLIYRGSGGDSPDIIQTMDGNLLFYFSVGFPTVNLTWDFRLYFLKMDLNGDSLIARNYYLERPDQNGISQIQLNELADSSIIFSCSAMVMKLSSSLDSVKAITFPKLINSVVNLLSDSAFILQHIVQIAGVDTVMQIVYSMNLDSLYILFPNNSIYNLEFGQGWHIGGPIKQISDSSFVTLLHKAVSQTDSVIFVLFDRNLSPVWYKYFSFNYLGMEFRNWEVENNTVTYWGIKYDPSFLNDSAFFYRLNINTGDSLQFKTFSAQNIYRDTWLEDLNYCSEGYVISGHAQADSTGWKSYFAVLDTNGNVTASVPTLTAPTMHVFNNPTVNEFEVELLGEKSYTFTLRDALGKTIEVKRGNGKVKFDLQNYSAGSYFLSVTGDQVKRSVVIMKE